MIPLRLSALLFPILGLALLGCQGERATSVLLITLDTTRVDRLGCYGRPSAGTPNLDRLAAEGTLFERAYTAVPITLPSHTSIFTGTYPTFHGVRDNGNYRVDPRLTTLTEILREAGHRTAAFVASYPVRSEFGLDQGFEVYDEDFESGEGTLRLFFDERPADQVAASAQRWLSEVDDDEPFFAWVHFFDPHAPYEPPGDLGERYASDPYQGEIATVDRAVGELIASLRSLGRYEDTLIVVVADHGEGLGEHGEGSHAALIYDTTVRVPLILRGPGVPARRVTSVARTIDLLPTVTDLLDLEHPRAVQGRSLRPLWNGAGDPENRPAYLETLWPRLHQGWSPLDGIVERDRKLIRATSLPEATPELYDVIADPRELSDLAGREPERLERLERRLDGLIAETTSEEYGRRRALTDADLESLRQLGYLGSTPDPREAGQHPREAIVAFTGLQRAVALVLEERFDEALALIDEVEQRFPDSLGVFEYRALCFKEMGSDDPAYLEKAIAQYERALEINPELENLWRTRAEVHRLLKEWEDAIACYQQARRISPGLPKTEKNYAAVLAEAGRLEEALEVLDAIISANPARIDLHNERGVHLEEAGHLEMALAAFEKASQLGPPDDPEVLRAHNRAGVVASALGRPEIAVAHFQAVNRVRPDNVFARPKLAQELERLGRRDEALKLWSQLARDYPEEAYFAENRDRLSSEHGR